MKCRDIVSLTSSTFNCWSPKCNILNVVYFQNNTNVTIAKQLYSRVLLNVGVIVQKHSISDLSSLMLLVSVRCCGAVYPGCHLNISTAQPHYATKKRKHSKFLHVYTDQVTETGNRSAGDSAVAEILLY